MGCVWQLVIKENDDDDVTLARMLNSDREWELRGIIMRVWFVETRCIWYNITASKQQVVLLLVKIYLPRISAQLSHFPAYDTKTPMQSIKLILIGYFY